MDARRPPPPRLLRPLRSTRSPRTLVVSVPEVLSTNAYQRLLYEQLEANGITLIPDARFDLGWLLSNHGPRTVVHFHWPQIAYRRRRSPGLRGRFDEWAAVASFAVRLAAARALSKHTKLAAKEIAQEAMKIASEICIFTNANFTIEEL